MPYINCLTIGQMKEMDILDNVPYKYFKNLHDDDDIEVDIYFDEDDDDDRPTYTNAVFKFDLKYDCSMGSLPLYTTKHFKVKINYNTSSAFALFMCSIREDTDDEDEEDEDK
jgi:hypothetical protein